MFVVFTYFYRQVQMIRYGSFSLLLFNFTTVGKKTKIVYILTNNWQLGAVLDWLAWLGRLRFQQD